MGIIEKQATRNALYSYLGAGLGFLTVVWFSHLLTPSQNGLLRILVSYAALFSQFANLGFNAVTIRFFPYFRNKEKGHHGFLFYALLVSLIGFLICWLVFIFLESYLVESNKEKSQLFVDYIFYLMPLTFFTVFFNIFDNYLRAGFSSVAGSFTKEFLQRIFILITLALFFLGWINFESFLFFYIFFTCIPTLILVAIIFYNKEWHIKPVKGFVSKELRREIIQLSLFSILAGGAGAIIINIDAIMINQFLGEAKTGIYGIAFYFGSIILIPARSIYRITSSIVAENFKENKIFEITKLYKQSCNNQLAIGLLLFIGIFANIDNIMHLLPAEYASGKNVILIISAGYLIEMATGINQVIMVNSPYFRYDTYLVFLLVIITITTNYIFIPLFGIIGSAIATAITVSFGNVLRFVFLFKKFQMQPYNKNTLKLLIIGVLCFAIGIFLPFILHTYLDIAVRSFSIGLLFVLLIFKTNATPEINEKIRKNISLVLRR
jgi:O-antigen/teichoic acid export membrane protein